MKIVKTGTHTFLQDAAAALDKTRGIAGPEGLVVATGSLYLVGRLLPLFGQVGGEEE